MALSEINPAAKRSLARRFFGALFQPSTRFSVLALLVLGIALGGAGVIGTQVAVHATGTNEFCLSCHEMTTARDEYHETAHYSNRTGVRAGCSDCHIPHAYPEKLWVKALSGTKDIFGHLTGVIDTPEKFEAKRLGMATSEQARMLKNRSAECRYCHDTAAMNPAKQKSFARIAHMDARKAGQTCIECHQGIAHNEPKQPGAQLLVAAPAAVTESKPSVEPAAAVVPIVTTPAVTLKAVPDAPEKQTESKPGPIAAPTPTAAEKFDNDAMLKLAKRNNCAGCHAMNEKKKGPSYRDSAAKYRGKPDPTATLVTRILAGGEGKEHPEVEVSEADATSLVRWVLAQ